jgi:hypothetical protein
LFTVIGCKARAVDGAGYLERQLKIECSPCARCEEGNLIKKISEKSFSPKMESAGILIMSAVAGEEMKILSGIRESHFCVGG